ncbi:MAG: hypothetical protein Q8K68_08770 [Nitrospirota bacterium]|nr:hypothetical protein [Nitrospirota bacterium]
MRKTVFLAVIVLLFAGAAFGFDKPLAVSDIVRKLDDSKQTSASIKGYAKEIKGKQAEGTGKVVDVLDGRRDRYRVTILTDGARPGKGFNVVLYTTMNSSSDLKKDQKIRFRGEVGRVSSIRGTSIDIHGEYEALQAKPATTTNHKKKK